MARFSLDSHTAERLLTGSVAPEDAPPGYGEVARLFQAAATSTAPGPLAGEQVAVAAVVEAIRAAQPATSPASRRKSVFTKAKLAAAGLAGAVSLTTGLAAANALPGAAQEAASDALAKVGISVPSPNSHSNGHADSRGKSARHHDSSSATSGNGPGVGSCAGEAHGDAVSAVAKSNANAHEAHGDAVSAVARCKTSAAERDANGDTHAATNNDANGDTHAATNNDANGHQGGNQATPPANNDSVGDNTSANTPGDSHADKASPSSHANSTHRP
jgi:hypothetical protein